MQQLLSTLKNGQKKKMILDTDVYNEIDDLYALAYAMLSPDKVELLAITAAPFLNSRSTSAADGMEQSYNEAFRVRGLVDADSKIPIYRGSTVFMGKDKSPFPPRRQRPSCVWCAKTRKPCTSWPSVLSPT